MPAVQLGDVWGTRADVIDGTDVCPQIERGGYQDVSHLVAAQLQSEAQTDLAGSMSATSPTCMSVY
jgi:hypothetical protein